VPIPADTRKTGNASLDRSTRMRLVSLGNAFEMEECVRECLASLRDGLTPTDALTILEEVPDELHDYEATKGVVKKVIDILGDTSSISGPNPKGLQTAKRTRSEIWSMRWARLWGLEPRLLLSACRDAHLIFFNLSLLRSGDERKGLEEIAGKCLHANVVCIFLKLLSLLVTYSQKRAADFTRAKGHK